MLIKQLPRDLQHIRIRTLRAEDLDAFHGYRSDPGVARFQGWAPMSVAQAAEFLRTQSACTALIPGEWHQLGIASLDADQLLGDIGVHTSTDQRQAEFGISLTAAAQGRGYATECFRGLLSLLFEHTPACEIVARTDARNVACIAALTRAGMQRTSTERTEYKGEICTEHTFAISRPPTQA